MRFYFEIFFAFKAYVLNFDRNDFLISLNFAKNVRFLEHEIRKRTIGFYNAISLPRNWCENSNVEQTLKAFIFHKKIQSVTLKSIKSTQKKRFVRLCFSTLSNLFIGLRGKHSIFVIFWPIDIIGLFYLLLNKMMQYCEMTVFRFS